jgi:8-oxo-dGTP pyrophosphatase MutT (NUDIX family)/phosphohistidine phosphatase SixA
MTNPSPPVATGPDVVAAGAVVTRKGPEGREVLLVHRPKYDDWSFPKGKQDPGEHVTATAVREVLEETGVEIRLGRPLRPQLYAVGGGRAKTVHYWVGHVVGDDDVSSYEINEEVDDLAWLSETAAKERMTYLDDIDLLDQFDSYRKTTSALLIVRHAKAEKRDRWDGPDPLRPLNELGQVQAEAMTPMLHAFGVARVVTSPSTRCVETVRPYATEQVLPMTELEELSEEGFDEAAAGALLSGLLATPEPTVLCSHRPALPRLLALLGVEEEPLAPGEVVVCHHRKGVLVATERHSPSQRGI